MTAASAKGGKCAYRAGDRHLMVEDLAWWSIARIALFR
jgi:hypothetical protein